MEQRKEDVVLVCIHGKTVMEEETYFIRNTLENISAFIVQDERDKAIYSLSNDLILNTFGSFINRCPDQNYLQELLRVLIPIQLCEVEPQKVEIVEF